jgi:hypothetical protein
VSLRSSITDICNAMIYEYDGGLYSLSRDINIPYKKLSDKINYSNGEELDVETIIKIQQKTGTYLFTGLMCLITGYTPLKRSISKDCKTMDIDKNINKIQMNLAEFERFLDDLKENSILDMDDLKKTEETIHDLESNTEIIVDQLIKDLIKNQATKDLKDRMLNMIFKNKKNI